MKRKKILNGILIALCVFLVLLAFVPLAAALWYSAVYGTELGMDSVLFTLFSEVNAAAADLVGNYLLYSLLPALLISAVVLFFLLFRPFKRKKKQSPAESAPESTEKPKKKRFFFAYPFSRGAAALISLVLCVALLITAGQVVDLFSWLHGKLNPGTLYEDEYVDPATVPIIFPEQKRNLIYIYLESMETTFLSKELGGGLTFEKNPDAPIPQEEIPVNGIPELTLLAERNTNFSDNGGVGGFRQVQGANWTIAAMVAQTAGIPLCLPLTDPNNTPNSYGNYSLFLPGVTCLTDILHENGYYQTLMVGSDASFGGRDKYWLQHGADHVYDYYTAKTDHIIGPKYHVWWGMEDRHLFEYAQKELPKIAKKGQPFSFTMLTVDTHHIGGYTCGLCKDLYEEAYENVYACSSKQVAKFVEWLQEQDFYENTTVIICGDHCSMDNGFMRRNMEEGYIRHVYNCVINAPVSTENTKYRQFCAFD